MLLSTVKVNVKKGETITLDYSKKVRAFFLQEGASEGLQLKKPVQVREGEVFTHTATEDSIFGVFTSN